MIWLGKFKYFGKLVAQERRSPMKGVHNQSQLYMTCIYNIVGSALFVYGYSVLFTLYLLGIILVSFPHYIPDKAHRIIKLFYLFRMPWIISWSWIELIHMAGIKELLYFSDRKNFVPDMKRTVIIYLWQPRKNAILMEHMIAWKLFDTFTNLTSRNKQICAGKLIYYETKLGTV